MFDRIKPNGGSNRGGDQGTAVQRALHEAHGRIHGGRGKASKRSKSSLVEELTEEGTKVRRFPGLAFRGEGPYREPWIVGTGLDVWELCEILDHYEGSIGRVVEDYDGVDERACRLALAYRREYPEEIGDAIAENNRTPEEWLALYPFIEHVAQ